MDFKQQYIDQLVHTYQSAVGMKESLPSTDVAEEIVELVQDGWDIKIQSEDEDTRVEVDIPRAVHKSAEDLVKDGLQDVEAGLTDQIEVAQSRFMEAFRAEMKTVSSSNPNLWPEDHWSADVWLDAASQMDCSASVVLGLLNTFPPGHAYVHEHNLNLPVHCGVFLDALAKNWWTPSVQAWAAPLVAGVRALEKRGFDSQKRLNAHFKPLWDTCIVQYALTGKERFKSAQQQLVELGVDIPATSVNLQHLFSPQSTSDVDMIAALERLFEFEDVKSALLPSDTSAPHVSLSWSAMAGTNSLTHASVVSLLKNTPAVLDAFTKVVLNHALEGAGVSRVSLKM